MKRLTIYRYDGKAIVIEGIQSGAFDDNRRVIGLIRVDGKRTDVMIGGSDLAILEDVR